MTRQSVDKLYPLVKQQNIYGHEQRSMLTTNCGSITVRCKYSLRPSKQQARPFPYNERQTFRAVKRSNLMT